mmetsp:Transcript_16117/g.48410  ORF Transcript_16117/g.48410 Transcript_16117/m.48410 type:complete len:389 (-) Transcript_16117:263-1429(-)
MGIKGLTQVLADNAPGAIKEKEFSQLCGRKVAVDASMFLYSFLIAIRPDSHYTLTDAEGNTTSHLQGLLNRTNRLISAGIKPVFVFDGKPPVMKSDELSKRRTMKESARAELKEAEKAGDDEAIARLVKRTVTVTQRHNDECKELLELMGMPVVQAPCEAEATCAALAKAGLVYATGTEDMDALTLGTPVLLRRLTFAENRKMPIMEINLQRALTELDLSMDQFIDLGILLGCDYVPKIKGLGPKRALEQIRTHGCIENILKNLDNKLDIPEGFHYQGARELFHNPDVVDVSQVKLTWKHPDEEGLIKYLCVDKNFNETRVRNVIAKLKKSRKQTRLDSFFSLKPKPAAAAASSSSSSSSSSTKRTKPAAAGARKQSKTTKKSKAGGK